MGEVYRAQDKELGRPVALKFLSSEVSSHERALKRFIQEAKAASALNHPNILTVYEIGREEDQSFIATEFVEGVTLRHFIRLGPKLLEILDVAIQISSALVAAHAAGIVHRDIKPENIMVRSDGIVKVLDFGLAKLTDKYDSSAGPEASTLAMINTEPGSVLGTVAYMSPEQAAGREVDARSDIWSLGIVLYEMVATRTPFVGASKSHIIVAIIDHEPPPLTNFAPEVPQALEWIIAEALTKDPEERCQTAKEMLGKLKRLKQRIESGEMSISMSDNSRSASLASIDSNALPLSSARETRHEAGRVTAPSAEDSNATTAVSNPDVQTIAIKQNKKALIVALLVGLIVIAAIGSALSSLLTQRPEVGPSQMRALTTSGQINGEDINGQVTISPDGKYVVCSANDAKQQASLWIRQVSTNSTVRIVPAESGGYFLGTTFSPDGEQIYYVAGSAKSGFIPALYRIPVLGGTPAKVLDRVSSAIGFSRDGQQFAFVRKNQGDMALMVANTDGSGEPRTISVRKDPDGFSTSGPSWSPDGKRITCGTLSGSSAALVDVPLEGGEPRPIGSQKWASVGRVIWLADGSGMIMTAQPESSSIGTQVWFVSYPSGQARRITNDLNRYGAVSLGLTADSTTMATIRQIDESSIWITAPNEDESHARPISKTGLPESVAWTPDGKIVYASRTGENWDLWMCNSDGSQSKQLTSDAFIDQQPSVSSDGRYIVFQSNRAGGRNLWRIDTDGSNPKQLTSGSSEDASPVSSADGLSVVFMSQRSGVWSIWKVAIDGGAPAQLTNRTSQFPSISPDGKQIAYYYTDVQEKNQPKLAVISFEGGEPVKTIDLPSSVQPITFAWMPDGRAIAYVDNASGILNVWSKPIDGSTPKQLTNFTNEFVNSFAISREGKIAVYRISATRDIVLIKDFR